MEQRIAACHRPLVGGRHLPTKYQVQFARRYGDATFTRPTTEEFDKNRPPAVNVNGRMWISYPHEHGAVLKLSCVEPHDDPWLGREADYCGEQLTMFWLLHAQSDVWLSVVGHEPVKMKPHDFVIFDDSITHHVMSTKLWAGVSWQQWPVDHRRD